MASTDRDYGKLEEDSEKWTDAVYFYPYVGDEYARGLVDGIRVMLLGESHYLPEDEARGRNVTRSEFGDYTTCALEPANSFFGKLQRIVTRNRWVTAEESQDAWKRVAYANIVQQSVGTKARERPTAAQWRTAQPALTEMIRRLTPDVVLVLGSATWNHISVGRSAAGETICAPRYDREIWLLPFDGGEAMSTWIYHPSTNMDSIDTSIRVMSELIERAARKRG